MTPARTGRTPRVPRDKFTRPVQKTDVVAAGAEAGPPRSALTSWGANLRWGREGPACKVSYMGSARDNPDGGKKTKEPSPLADILAGLLRKSAVADRLREFDMRQRWPEIVGEGIARHSRPGVLHDGRLLVNVDSPTWSQELTLGHGGEIIKKINEALGRSVVKEISFRVGSLGERD